MEKMLAAVFAGAQTASEATSGLPLELREVPRPSVSPGDILLRVAANTICGTDVRILRGEKSSGINPGVVLGHEIAGYVVESGGEVPGFQIGDLVGLVPSIPCGHCYYCKNARENLCTDSVIFGYAQDGGLAEYLLIPSRAIKRGVAFVANPKLSPVEVALAEPLGCVLSGAEKYRVNAGDTVVILGAGPIGLLHLQVARLRGASAVIVSDPSSSRRALATKLGATAVVDPLTEDLARVVHFHSTAGTTEEAHVAGDEGQSAGSLGADVAVICIGHSSLIAQALECVRKGGRVSVFAGFAKGGTASFDPNLIHYGEIEVYGASNASRAHHELALRLIAEGKIDVASLHTDTFALTEVVEGIEYAASGQGVKIAIVPDGELI